MRRALLATALLLAGVSGAVTGCAETAAASAAASAAQVAMDTVPSAIRAVADMAVVNNNKTDWGKPSDPQRENARISLPVLQRSWVKLAPVSSFPRDGGRTLQYGNSQIAVFNFESRGEWYATQNKCPHMQDMVLGRGLIGDQQGVPKVAQAAWAAAPGSAPTSAVDAG